MYTTFPQAQQIPICLYKHIVNLFFLTSNLENQERVSKYLYAIDKSFKVYFVE